ncbi:MAG: hypothetical protein ABIB71_05965 [Candidatus Woesearchaeota archaeon]
MPKDNKEDRILYPITFISEDLRKYSCFNPKNQIQMQNTRVRDWDTPVIRTEPPKPKKREEPSDLDLFLHNNRFRQMPTFDEAFDDIYYTVKNFGDGTKYYDLNNPKNNLIDVSQGGNLLIKMEPLFSTGSSLERVFLCAENSPARWGMAKITAVADTNKRRGYTDDWIQVFYDLDGRFYDSQVQWGRNFYILDKESNISYAVFSRAENKDPKPKMDVKYDGYKISFKIGEGNEEKSILFPERMNVLYLLQSCIEGLQNLQSGKP